jgi:hypothetical protein
MKVFVSSTAVDLPEHRPAVAGALERLGLHVARMESFGARPEDATEASLGEIEGSEIFVGIYAHRYGYVPADSTSSITESEFNYAYALRRPTFCFFVDDEYPWPPKLMETSPGKGKLFAFKTRIEKLIVVDVMRMFNVAGGERVREANKSRYGEFVDTADQHLRADPRTC